MRDRARDADAGGPCANRSGTKRSNASVRMAGQQRAAKESTTTRHARCHGHAGFGQESGTRERGAPRRHGQERRRRAFAQAGDDGTETSAWFADGTPVHKMALCRARPRARNAAAWRPRIGAVDLIKVCRQADGDCARSSALPCSQEETMTRRCRRRLRGTPRRRSTAAQILRARAGGARSYRARGDRRLATAPDAARERGSDGNVIHCCSRIARRSEILSRTTSSTTEGKNEILATGAAHVLAPEVEDGLSTSQPAESGWAPGQRRW